MLAEIRRAFGPLGWTSFGGPAAHLSYFRTEVVQRRRWMTDNTYADLVSLAQFTPGPGSSKVGMAIGYDRAGLTGMAYSWLWFTAPSALIMGVFGLSLGTLADAGWVHGLLAAAAGVVAHAVVGMAHKLITGPVTAAFAVATFASLFWLPQLLPILLAAAAGALLLRPTGTLAQAPPLRTVPPALGWGSAILFFGLLVVLRLAALSGVRVFERASAFYESGALVFGGGHVVLPLLEEKFVASGWVSQADFLSGYSLAQAMPGPLFTFATYVGAVDGGIGGAVLGTLCIFLPGALLTLAGLYFWGIFRANPRVRGAFAGVNAAVVGLLAHALWDPIITHGVTGAGQTAIAVGAFAALVFKAPPWTVALGAAALGLALL
ncbi:chromate efflux transporter [Corynebacterium phocae]|nr:chromate efflux transporter [Corynebacterium phocae]